MVIKERLHIVRLEDVVYFWFTENPFWVDHKYNQSSLWVFYKCTFNFGYINQGQ
jgi:hypothetical protein